MDYIYDPIKALPIMEHIAREAGAILMRHFESPDLVIETKISAADIVTQADKQSDAYIRAQFAENFPLAGVITEEGSNIDPQKRGPGEVWMCADPLDGTTNFSCNVPHFSVSIAMLDCDHQPLAGIVYDPNRNELFKAIKGNGSYLVGQTERKLKVRENTDLVNCLISTGFSPTHLTNPDNNIAELSTVLPKVRCIRRFGSACLDLCWVAAARFDGYFERGPHIWDIVAGRLIATESGALCTNYKGEILDKEYQQRPMIDVLCAAPTIHPQLSALIVEARRPFETTE